MPATGPRAGCMLCVCGAATNSDGQQAVKACSRMVRCRKSCAKYRGMRMAPISEGSFSGTELSYR